MREKNNSSKNINDKINIINKSSESVFLVFLSLWMAHTLGKHLADEGFSKF